MASENRPMLRLAVIAMAAILGSACSRTEFAYRNADWLLEYYAWQTVSISEEQRDHWQPILQSTLQRHRVEELPLIIAYLNLAGRIVRKTEGRVGASCLVDGALFLYQRHARLAVDLAAPLLADLDAVQIRHIADYTMQRHQDDVKRYLDTDPQQRKVSRQERILERIENWTGKLNDRQRKQISDALENIPDLSASWLAYRAQQVDILLAKLNSGTNAESLRKFLDAWWVHRDGRSDENRRLWRIATNEFVRLMDELATTLTNRQRARFEDRLDDLRTDLESFLPSQQLPVNMQVVPTCDRTVG